MLLVVTLTERNLVACAPAFTQHGAGEGELLFELTNHAAILTQQARDVHSQFLRVLGRWCRELVEAVGQISPILPGKNDDPLFFDSPD